jgi:N-acylneuraminate cytidylyltransferase
MKILALITARGGSKRLPGKNIRIFGGKPLIVWSIDIAKDIPEICDILVSSDDPAIAEVAGNAGAMVPWLRPAELASDEASSVDVAVHALDWYEQMHGPIDGLLLLQPTSPFRSRETLLRGMALFNQYRYRSVVGVSSAQSHPMWCFRVDGNSMCRFMDSGKDWPRSQDLPPAYVVNGGFYLIAPRKLRDLQSFYSDDMVPLVVDEPKESIDIDTDWDWKMAEAALIDNSVDDARGL